MIEQTVCFTGHRTHKLGISYPDIGEHKVLQFLEYGIQIAYDNGIRNYISGGALGVDQWAAQQVLVFREQHPDVKLIIARPFPSQHIKWNLTQIAIYNRILKLANEVIDVSPDPYSPQKMQIRNIWMVDRSCGVIAVWNGSSGGTKNCYDYAVSKNRFVLQYNPITNIMTLGTPK